MTQEEEEPEIRHPARGVEIKKYSGTKYRKGIEFDILCAIYIPLPGFAHFLSDSVFLYVINQDL